MFCEADAFLNELHKLFERNKKAGSVWITMKRSSLRPTPRADRKAPGAKGGKGGKQQQQAAAAGGGDGLKCLIRATDGKRKISTALGGAELAKFQASYALILRAHMDALKRREKPKKKEK
ncbi:SRP14 [Scenedesmus sp. PABB004]|nr:SRP14 [Scenedesmus sp. PABB004]